MNQQQDFRRGNGMAHSIPLMNVNDDRFATRRGLGDIMFGGRQPVFNARGVAQQRTNIGFRVVRAHEGDPVTGAGARPSRHFVVNIDININDTYRDVADRLINEIEQGENDYNDGDEYERDTYIDGYYGLGGFEGQELYAGDERDYLAFHDFRPNYFQRTYAMGKMIMAEFPCIYEALMMILYYERYQIARPAPAVEWIGFVMSNFMLESSEFQDHCYAGRVKVCLDTFNQNRGFNITVFNCYTAVEDAKKLKEEPEGQERLYFLCYWGEHVFPIHRSKCFELAEAQDLRYKRIPEKKLFVLIPPVIQTLYTEMKLAAMKPLDFQTRYWQFENCFNKFTAEKIVCYSHQFSKKNVETVQRGVVNSYRKLMADEGAENRVQFVLERVQSGITGKGFTIEQAEQMYKNQWHTAPFFMDPQSQIVTDKVLQRERQFDRIGLVGVDIETCDDSSLEESIYTMRPYVVSIYGRLQQIYQHEDGGMRVRLVENIEKYFEGIGRFDCISRLITWLIENGHVWSTCDLKKPYQKSYGEQQVAPQLFNYFIAHNGFGFDYRYFYEKLMEMGSEFHIVGDMNQTKCVQGAGLFFYDFALIYKEKLKDLAKTFFPNEPNKQKLENDDVAGLDVSIIKGWFKRMSQGEERPAELQSLLEYNVRDSKVVYHLAEKFFRWTFTTPFGHSFLPKMFYHSLSALSWDMWLNCFFTEGMFTNRLTLAIENRMKIGGLTTVYRESIQCGIMIDVNSFYPSIMMNKMPLHHKEYRSKSIHRYPETVLINRRNYKQFVKPHDIYQIKYRFPADCKLPTIVEKTGETLVMVLESCNYDEESDIGSIYVFGETINVAIECAAAEIKLFETVQFIPGNVHRSFIEYCYEKRLAAKLEKDALGDKFFKNMMNMCFGKHGQRQYPKVKFGSWTQIKEWYHMLQLDPTVKKSSIDLKRVLSNEVPIYELKYEQEDDEFNHKGATVRISAFIMEMARTYLMRMKHAIADAIGWTAISYCDTDSIAITFDKVDPLLANRVQLKYNNYKDLRNEQEENGVSNEQLDALERKTAEEIQQMIKSSEVFKKIQKITLKDVRDIESEEKIPLLDESRLGASKIEKFLINGIFTGQKQYGMVYAENGRIKESVKAKGVPRDQRTMQMIQEMAFSVNAEGEVIHPMVLRQIETWGKVGTGVSIYPRAMIVRPTLVKRDHDHIRRTSVPFETINHQIEHKRKYDEAMLDQKEEFREQIGDILKAIKDDGRYIAFQQLGVKKGELNKDIRKAIKEDWLRLIESRRRLMIRLPKVKYGFIQDEILRLFLNDTSLQARFNITASKMIAITLRAIYTKRIMTKKSLSVQLSQVGEDGQRYAIDDEQSARVIVFSLFCYHTGLIHDLGMTQLFKELCYSMSSMVQEYVDGVKNKDACRHWKSSVIHALQFLQCPITIQNSQDMCLDNTPRITCLWRLFSNTITKIQNEGSAFEQDIEVDKNQMEQTMKMYMLSDTIAPVFSTDTYHFNYVLEVPRSNEQIQEIMIHRAKPHGKIADQGIVDSLIDRYMAVYAQPTYDKVELLELDKAEKKDLQERRVLLARNVLASANMVDLSQITTEYARIFLEQVLAGHGLPSQMLDQQLTYGKIFDLKTHNAKIAVRSKDVGDFVLVLQFFFFGGWTASSVLKRLLDQWNQYTGLHGKTFQIANMIEIMQIIFQRPKMFGDIAHRDNIPAKVRSFFEFIKRDILDKETDEEDRDEFVRQALNTMIADPQLIHPNFKTLLEESFNKKKEFGLHAYNYIQQVLYWFDESSPAIKDLRMILILKRGEEERGDPMGGLMKLFDDNERKAGEYILATQQNMDNWNRENDSPRFDFAAAWKGYDEDSFIVPDHQRDRIDQAYKQMELVDYEMSAEIENRQIRNLKRQREMDAEEEEKQELQLRAADKKQGQVLKRLKRTGFIEDEAEEGEENSLDKIRFDDNDHIWMDRQKQGFEF